MINFARSDDFEVHEEKVDRHQAIDTQTDQNNGIKQFSVFAGHKFLIS